MATKSGDRVKVHYTARLEDGTVFDTSEGREPMEITLGEGQIISGLENGIVGMQPGEEKKITVPPEQGYGDKREDMFLKVREDDFPEEINPTVGQALQVTLSDGRSMKVVVDQVSQGKVTIDANHPLAGQTLVFDVRLLEFFR